MDREKVIKGLEYCKHTDGVECPNCPYWHEDDCVEILHADVIAMLKEQRWVKCSDGMPEERDTIFAKLKGTDKWRPAMFEKMSEDVRVVVVFEDGTRRVHHSFTVDGEWECEKNPLKRTVTHWMLNPELPND